jgi:hypothetical protein
MPNHSFLLAKASRSIQVESVSNLELFVPSDFDRLLPNLTLVADLRL